MNWPAYITYQHSNVEWIGRVPEHWKITKASRKFSFAMGQTILKEDLSQSDGWPVYSATEGDHFFGRMENPTVRLSPGDLVIPARGNSIGHVKLVETKATTTQTTIYAKILDRNEINPKFAYYFLSGQRTNLFRFTQTAIPQITVAEVSSNPYIVPPMFEQDLIVRFLNCETAKIDSLISKQKQLIATLREDRIATITNAVTKGLDSNVEMTDSGVGWLGEIPCKWKLMKLRHLGQAIIGLTYSPEEIVDETVRGTLVLRSGNIQKGSLSLSDCVYVTSLIPDQLRVRSGDVLLCSRNGSRALIGKNILIDDRVAGQTFGAFMTVYRSVHNPFLYWVFNSRLFVYQTSTFLSSTINQLTTGNLKKMEVPLPPVNEQRAIVEYLEVQTKRIDTLINKADQVISTLLEYRTALITAAVTGKIDVRGVA